ncbi:hypothetical protein C0992_009032 [Termitomyces sp. T32_za158]|nr:hypothetical protein C0992_009032 [Termitomyces sp. T32_za158]
MSTVGRSSDDEESQASQLLHAMLHPEIISRKAGDIHGPYQGNDTNMTRTNSPSRSSVSLHYDFHGLGQTQTQCLDEETDLNENSQKENIETAKEESHKITATLASNTPRSIAVKAVSFHSPQKKSTAPPILDNSVHRQPKRCTTSSNTSRRHVASPVSSQDSFGVLDQDPGQQFLATSKQFNVPLSELPKVVLPNVAVPSTRSSRAYTYSGHQQYRHERSSSPPEGTVLVESTPSASGGSQSQSYPDVQRLGTTPMEVMPDPPSGQSQYVETSRPANNAQNTTHYPIEECLSDAPSSFYADHNDESFPSTALASTQPSTQLEDDNTMDVEPVHPFDVVHETSAYTGNTSSTATTNPRSLFNMVDPKKRYRYQHLIQNQLPVVTESSSIQTEDKPPATATVHRSPIPNLAQSPPIQAHSQTLVKTRPSLNEESRQPCLQDLPVLPTNDPPQTSRREVIGSHGTDVVPDSEPLRDHLLEKRRSITEGSSGLPINVSRSGNIVKNLNVQEGIVRSLDDNEDQEVVSRSQLLPPRDKRQSAVLKGQETLVHDYDLGRRPGSSRQEKLPSPGSSNQEAAFLPPIPHFDRSVPTSNVRTTRASAGLSTYRPPSPPGTVSSRQRGVVPSSIPNEGICNAGVKSCANATSSKKGKGTLSTTRVGSKRTPAVVPKRTRRRAESNPASDDEALSQGGNYESDSTTDDITMDPNFGGGTTSRKRKRSGSSVKSAEKKPKSSKKVKKAASSTPSTRQPNRLRSMTSASRMSDVVSTRVFALWKQDSCYYSGSVYADVGGGIYEVHFDDRAKAHVHIDQMRVLDLRVNDDVMIPNIMRGFKVDSVDKLASSQLVGVCLDEEIKEMDLASLRIAAKTISAAWQDRTLSRHSIVPIIKSEPSRASPAPSGLSSVPSRRPGRGHIFEKTAFVVSVSYIEDHREREKENLLSRIRSNAGLIVNDWQDVLNMQGTYSMHNNRWVIKKREARWIGNENIARIFLVADHPSFKPKFLLALALGVPCLKVEWLYDTVAAGEEKDWLAYMLGQGFSETLSTQISQQVDINWGTSVHHLSDIMENRVPCKLFSGKSILCVGDVVPKMRRSKKPSIVEEKAQEAHNAITRIILAMGADCVEAVTDIDHASAPLNEFDFIVIKKAEHYSLGMVPDKTVQWSWVKECLVASRLLPHPEWGLESQEA